MKHSWLLPDAPATEALGRAFACDELWGADAPTVLYLRGELGAGKTTLAAALLQGLGVMEAVRSPSYTLIELYEARRGWGVHIDLYRLQDGSELEQLGLRDYLQPRTLIMIEWPERALEALPGPDLAVTIQTVPSRIALVETATAAGERWLSVAIRQTHQIES